MFEHQKHGNERDYLYSASIRWHESHCRCRKIHDNYHQDVTKWRKCWNENSAKKQVVQLLNSEFRRKSKCVVPQKWGSNRRYPENNLRILLQLRRTSPCNLFPSLCQKLTADFHRHFTILYMTTFGSFSKVSL